MHGRSFVLSDAPLPRDDTSYSDEVDDDNEQVTTSHGPHTVLRRRPERHTLSVAARCALTL